MATLKELKGRIGSVASNEKITGAMKMISSAKMRQAEQALRRLTPYRTQVEAVLSTLLGSDATFSSPLTRTAPLSGRVAVVVFGSDDGLCGAFNANIVKHLTARLAQLREQAAASGHGPMAAPRFAVFPVGRKMAKACAKLAAQDPSLTVEPMDDGVNSKSAGEAVRLFAQRLQTSFANGWADVVELLYMRFITAGRQRPRVDTMLPVDTAMFATDKDKATDKATDKGQSQKYTDARPVIFEPGPDQIFNAAVPMYLTAMMQEVFTQSRASEQAARVIAMQTANDNAKKLLEQLSLEYNKLRQQSITNELLDIVGGQVR